MRRSFILRLGTCRRRSSPRLPVLFVSALPPASLPAPALGAWLDHSQGHPPSRADLGPLHPSLLPLKQPCPFAILSPAPFSVPHLSQSSPATAPRLVPSVPPVTSSAEGVGPTPGTQRGREGAQPQATALLWTRAAGTPNHRAGCIKGAALGVYGVRDDTLKEG